MDKRLRLWVVLVSCLATMNAQSAPTPRDHASTPQNDAPSLLRALAEQAPVTPGASRKLEGSLRTLAQAPLLLSAKALSADGRDDAANGLVQVHVYLKRGYSTPYLAALTENGLQPTLFNEALGIVQGEIDTASLEALAALEGVRRITRPDYGVAQKEGAAATAGDAAVRADKLRQLGLLGAGVKIGVISDGVENLAAAQRSGDLPAIVTVVRGCNSGDAGDGVCDEGTAMLEIIHDVAPQASLTFCGGQSGASGISNLDFIDCATQLSQAPYDVDIIVDDLLFATEPMLEDGGEGTISYAVQQAINRGVIWVSAAGNNGGGRGYRQYYTADYIPLADLNPALPGPYDSLNDFGLTATRSLPLEQQVHDARNTVRIGPDQSIKIVLQWNDVFDGTATSDYDVFLVAKNTNLVLASAVLIQDGDNSYPQEALQYRNETAGTLEADVVVARKTGTSVRRLKLFSCFQKSSVCDLLYANDSGEIIGHPALPDVIAVGAIDVDDPGLDTIEDFSSTGPAVLYRPVMIERAKPDLVAVDSVAVTGAGGFPEIFTGTSAAAPHVAAVLALLKGSYPNKDVKKAILESATDRGDAGRDDTFGAGLLNAEQAYTRAGQLPDAISQPDTGTGTGTGTGGGTGTPSGGNGDGGAAEGGGALSWAWLLFGLAAWTLRRERWLRRSDC